MFKSIIQLFARYAGDFNSDINEGDYLKSYVNVKMKLRPYTNEFTTIVSIFVISLGLFIDPLIYSEVQFEIGIIRVSAIVILLMIACINRISSDYKKINKYTLCIFLTNLLTACLILSYTEDSSSTYFGVFILLSQSFLLGTEPKEAIGYTLLSIIGYLTTALFFCNLPSNIGEIIICAVYAGCGGIVAIFSAFFRNNLMFHSHVMRCEYNQLLNEQRKRNDGLELSNKELESSQEEVVRTNMNLMEVNKETELARKNAVNAVTSRVDFLGSVTHRLLTHITSMEGFITLIGDHIDNEGRRRSYLGKLNKSCHELKVMSDEISDLSMLEAQNYHPKKESFDIREVVSSLICRMDTEIASKKTYIDFIIRGSTPSNFIGDVTGLTAILRNLLSESLSMIDSGGITLTIDFSDKLHIEVIDQAILPNFKSRLRPESLGFVLSTKLVNFYAGDIKIKESAGKIITNCNIPIEKVSKKSTFQKRSIASCGISISNKSITVADTRESFCKSIASLLEYAGVEVQALVLTEKDKIPTFSCDILILRDGLFNNNLLEMFETISGCEKILSIESTDPQSNKLFHDVLKPNRYALYALSGPIIFYDYLGAIAGEKPKEVDTDELDSQRQEGLDILLGANKLPFKGLRILIVDDNSMNLSLGREMLTLLGVKVDTAENGIKAVKLCSDKRYDIILMDLMMPVMDGVETSKSIRKSGKNTSTPFIGLTAKSDYEENTEYVELMEQIFTKPFSRNDVENAIAEMRATGKLNR